MNEILFKLILALIPIICAILTTYIIPFIKEKIGAEKLAKYEYWTSMSVNAAEMLFKEAGMGANKKEYVTKFLNEIFNKNKVVITEEQIEILIESAVQELNNIKSEN